MFSTPLEEIRHRIAALQAAMIANNLDGALIVQRADLYYLTGTGQDAHLFVPAEGNPLLMVRKTLERAAQETPLTAVIPLAGFSGLKKGVESAGPPLRTLGMELDVLPVNNYRVYENLFADATIRDVSPLIKEIRMIKSPYELALIEQAAQMNDAFFREVREVLREGMTEIEFAGQMEAFYRKLGHQGHVRARSFNQEMFYGHIMSGSNLAIPSAAFSPTGGPGMNPSFPQGAGIKTIKRNEPVQIDYVGAFGGYLVDQARVFFLGEPPEKFLKIQEVALAIQAAIVTQGVPGTSAEHLYEMAVEMADQAGLREGFLGYPEPVSFVGHGVGLELDEWPVIGRKSPHTLREGMVIAVEPKFIIPGEGLAGIENTFVVTKTGPEKLTRFDDAIQALP
jgi:Xaa-Pro dipeptidase